MPLNQGISQAVIAAAQTAAITASAPVSPVRLNVAGHSYSRGFYGVADRRSSTVYRVAAGLRIDDSGINNLGTDGAMLLGDGITQGGLPLLMNRLIPTRSSAPYTSLGGLGLLFFGINDLGKLGDTTQLETAYKHATRAAISRLKAAAFFDDTHSSVVYAGTWSATTGQFGYCTNGTNHYCTATTSRTITITVPSDFTSGTIGLGFIGSAGSFGGAGSVTVDTVAAGTVATSALMPTGANHGYACLRLTGLTAGTHSIVITPTSVDASGNFAFDGWWIEDANAPVVVANVPRLPAAGYSSSSWTAGAPTDTTVGNYNTAIASVVAEFPTTSVAVADIDAALGKNTANFSVLDSIHPNETGAALAAAAILTAIASLSAAVIRQVPGPPPDDAPGVKGGYGLAFAPSGALATATGTQAEARATPIFITQPTLITALGCEITTAGSTGALMRLAIHADDGSGAYPYQLVVDAGTVAATAASTSGSGTLAQINSGAGIILTRGWYWLSATPQGSPTTLPTMRTWNSFFPNVGLTSSNAAGVTSFGNALCYAMTGVTGAWSGVANGGAWTNTPVNQLNPPRVFVVTN